MHNTKYKTIFIAGFQRSGTTWFSNLFNSHPDVIYRHESIGRCFTEFSESLFKSLKYDFGLSDSDYVKIMEIIAIAHVETDRPPFFYKNYIWLQSPKVHQALWFVAKTLPFFQPVYYFLFKPRVKQQLVVMKETRSSLDMESIIRGLRVFRSVFLFRHPCGCIASILSGINSGIARLSTPDERKMSYQSNIASSYFSQNKLSEEYILSLPEHEYQAVLWRLHNDNFIAFAKVLDNCIYISYENFMKNTQINVEKLQNELSITPDQNTLDFIEASSNNKSGLSKDSKNQFFSVYQQSGFDPEKWRRNLTKEQIEGIQKHTMDTYEQLLTLDYNQ